MALLNESIALDDVLAIHEGLLVFEGEQNFVEVETAPQVFERRKVVTGLSDGIKIDIVRRGARGDRQDQGKEGRLTK